jgi:hypothetical protein
MERNDWVALFYGDGSDFLSKIQELEERGLGRAASFCGTIQPNCGTITDIQISMNRSCGPSALRVADPHYRFRCTSFDKMAGRR